MVKITLMLIALILSGKVYSQQHLRSVDDSVCTILVLSSMPEFEGNLRESIEDIHYPFSALRDNVEGKVFLRFTVDTLGHTNNQVIVRGIRHDLDEEALRVANMLRVAKSSYQNQKRVSVEMTIPFTFAPYAKHYKNYYSDTMKIDFSAFNTSSIGRREMKRYSYGIFDNLEKYLIGKDLLIIPFLNPWAAEGFDYKDYVDVYSLGLVSSRNEQFRNHLIAIVYAPKDIDAFAYRLCMIKEVQGNVRSIMIISEGQKLNGHIVSNHLKKKRNVWIQDNIMCNGDVIYNCTKHKLCTNTNLESPRLYRIDKDGYVKE